MIEFKKTPSSENKHDLSTVTISVDKWNLTLDEALDLFEDFLLACGYGIEKESLQIRGKDED